MQYSKEEVLDMLIKKAAEISNLIPPMNPAIIDISKIKLPKYKGGK
jgi:hypothetical protein